MTPEQLGAIVAAIVAGLGLKEILAYLVRRYTNPRGVEADTEAVQELARERRARADNVAVRSVVDALEQVERLSAAKDAQIAQVRQESADQAARHSQEIIAVKTELASLRAEQDALMRSWGAHNQWDIYILSEVRKINEDFPDPPPLKFERENR